MKRVVKGITIGLALLLIGVSLWFFRPWAEYQSWRWYTAGVESWRADHFSHWERVQPYSTLKASTNPRVYKRNISELASVSYEFEGRRYPITHYIEKANIAGLMVLRDGEVNLEYYGKGITADSRYHIWSATKSFTSTLIGMALFDGKISSLDDAVEQYAAQFKGTAYGSTSIRHVMMMSSGIDFFHFKGKPDRTDMYWDTIQRGGDFDKWAGALGRRVPSGTDFNYIATDTQVLSAVLRGAYDKSYIEIVQEKLWEPGGFAGDALWGQDYAGHEMGHCCLSLRLQEFAHLGQLYLDDLVFNGKTTVSNDWFEWVANAQAPFQEPHENAQGKLVEGYSFQFWLPENYDQEFMASGAFGQYLWIDKKREFVVAQYSTGQPVSSTGASGAGPREKEAVMRALGTFVTQN